MYSCARSSEAPPVGFVITHPSIQVIVPSVGSMASNLSPIPRSSSSIRVIGSPQTMLIYTSSLAIIDTTESSPAVNALAFSAHRVNSSTILPNSLSSRSNGLSVIPAAMADMLVTLVVSSTMATRSLSSGAFIAL